MTPKFLGWFRRNCVALLTIGVALLGVLASAYYANEADQSASTAAEAAKNAEMLASSAFSIANNYPPSIEVSSTSLELRETGCSEYLGNVSCIFTGTFNVSFAIIGPHQGTYNITFLGLANWVAFTQVRLCIRHIRQSTMLQ
jgi:Tfp pilus assembly protein PilV